MSASPAARLVRMFAPVAGQPAPSLAVAQGSQPRQTGRQPAKPITAAVDGRKSALALLKSWQTRHLLAEGAVQYLARGPQYACGMLAGFRLAIHVLRDSQQALQYLRQLAKDEPA